MDNRLLAPSRHDPLNFNAKPCCEAALPVAGATPSTFDTKMISPPRLHPGDEIRVLALSRSLGGVLRQGDISEADVEVAVGRLKDLGLIVSFGQHVYECNEHLTAQPSHRVEDLRDALEDPSVAAILACVGGIGAAQLLDLLDYDLIASNPKIFCGYSDVTKLWSAIGRRSQLVTYYGPNFTSFMMREGFNYTYEAFSECLFGNGDFSLKPCAMWSDDDWARAQDERNLMENDGFWAVQEGRAVGRIVGGTYYGLNMLQGSPYFPDLRGAVLFLEMPACGKATLMALDTGLRMLALQPGFEMVKGIVLGRYSRQGQVTLENLTALLAEIPNVRGLPVLANADFGHTTPCATIPIGGRCEMRSERANSHIQISRD